MTTTRCSPLLRQAGRDGTEVERELRRLLTLKTKAEYEPDDIAPSVAVKAVDSSHPDDDHHRHSRLIRVEPHLSGNIPDVTNAAG
jgi:hypothetical protein